MKLCNCVPGWMTVWLSSGPESCKVELSLGCTGLDGGGQARIGWSGHQPSRRRTWALAAWALVEATWCRLRRKKTERGL